MVEKKKVIIALAAGYFSIWMTNMAVCVDFAYDLYFIPGIMIPIIIAMVYGGRYAFICCTLGLSMFQPFLVLTSDGMANIAVSAAILVFSTGHGICRSMIKERQESFVIQYLYQFILIQLFLLLNKSFVKNLVRLNKILGIRGYTYLPDNIINVNATFLLEIMTIFVITMNTMLLLPIVKKWLKEPVRTFDKYSYSVVLMEGVILVITACFSGGNVINNLLCITFSVNEYQNNVGTVQLTLLKAAAIVFCADFVAHFIQYYCEGQQYQIEMAKIQEAVFESSEDMIWSVNGLGGKIMTANHVARNFFSQRNEKYEDISFLTIFDKEEIDFWEDSFEKVKEEKNYTTEFYDKETTKFYNLQMHWIDLDVNQYDVAVFAKDITSEILLDEKLKEYNQELENRVLERTKEIQAVNNELEDFGYMVAHELKAPLRAIDLYNQILQEEAGDTLGEEARTAQDMISMYCRKAIDLVAGILNYSKMKTKKFQVVRIQMNQMVSDVVDDLRHINVEQKIALTMDQLPVIMADEMLMQCCIYNILSNAVKYSSKREVTELNVTYDSNENEHVFHFKDNGVGFSMEEAGKLFQIFERMHSDTEYEGTGIGLATVKKIIEKHGGTLQVEAKENKGCMVSFSLPK